MVNSCVWHDAFMNVTWLVGCVIRVCEPLKCESDGGNQTSNNYDCQICNKVSKESPYISNTYSRESPEFQTGFHLSKRSPRHSKDWAGKYLIHVAWLYIDIHTYIYMYMHTYIHTHIYIYTHMHMYMYTHIYICMHIRIYIYTYMYTYIYIHICICICIHLSKYVCIYIYIWYTYTCVCIYIKHMHTYTCIYVYIYIYIYAHKFSIQHTLQKVMGWLWLVGSLKL